MIYLLNHLMHWGDRARLHAELWLLAQHMVWHLKHDAKHIRCGIGIIAGPSEGVEETRGIDEEGIAAETSKEHIRAACLEG
jgi:hypothetical protein